MPPIPIHSNSPISAAKAKEQPTLATDAPPADQAAASYGIAPNTTAAAPPAPASQPSYPPAQPGQPAVPVATPTPNQLHPQQPPIPTKTSPLARPELDANTPAPPQPGFVPSIPQQTASQQAPSSYQPQAPPIHIPHAMPPPPQLAMAPPTTNQAPTHSTSTTTTMSSSAYAPLPNPLQAHPPTTLPSTTSTTQPADLSHPPGYQQDPRAAEMTPAQRAAQEQAEREGSVLAGLGGTGSSGQGTFRPSYSAVSGNAPVMGGGSAGNESTTQSVMNSGAEMGGAAWDAAKKFMGGVAEKVGEMEGEVWRRVNGEK